MCVEFSLLAIASQDSVYGVVLSGVVRIGTQFTYAFKRKRFLSIDQKPEVENITEIDLTVIRIEFFNISVGLWILLSLAKFGWRGAEWIF